MGQEWDVFFGPLEAGQFLERLSRFHARVAVAEGERLAHVPNSGRLRELLLPGAEVALRRVQEAVERLTPFDLLLARVSPEERGPRAPEVCWACLDARLPPRVLAAALARGALPSLRGFQVARMEPALGVGRADLLLAGAAGEAVVEAKSVTLVRGGAALFPDSPTLRGTTHARTLAGLTRRGRRGVMVFVVRRPDAASFRANEPADPAFAGALRMAARAGVEVISGVCQVSWQGMRWAGEVTWETYPASGEGGRLVDHLRPGLRLVFCGMNPGHYSACYGMYFARPGNLFWPALRRAGILSGAVGPGDEQWLMRTHALGFTDVVKRPTGGIDEVTAAEWAVGAERLRQKLRHFCPRAVCFVGLRGARAVLGAGVRPGPQAAGMEGIPAFVVPSTSGRQAFYRPRDVLGWFRALGTWLESVA